MSLADSTRKEILKKKYRRFRSHADEAKEEGDTSEAADYYHRSARVVEELAEMETNSKLRSKRTELAENLRDAAEKLESDGYLESDEGENGSSPTDTGGTDPSDDSNAYLVESPDLDFDDVGGMADLKETLTETIIDPLDRPDMYERYGLGTVKGVLLHGPPGTGKTYLTRALAGKLEFNYIELEASDLTSSLVGEAADNVSEVFEVAKNNQPCLVFLDEIDAITAERSGGRQKTMSESQMITQFLTEMSSLGDTDVVFIAATNLPDAIDGAAWRRFDKRIEVPPPDAEGRQAVLETLLEERPTDDESINWEALGSMTNGYTPSDLELVVNAAARAALAETDETGTFQQITQRHIKTGIRNTDTSLDAWTHG
jgi:transitional endoplasmic reticulum ATPase